MVKMPRRIGSTPKQGAEDVAMNRRVSFEQEVYRRLHKLEVAAGFFAGLTPEQQDAALANTEVDV